MGDSTLGARLIDGIVNEREMKTLFKIEPVFAQINDRYGAPPPWQREPGFLSLSRIILEQQVSLSSAEAHFKRLRDYVGTFTPESLLLLSDEEFRNCHISRQKAKYLRELSLALVEGRLSFDNLTGLSDEDVRDLLTKIKGIGRWTSDIYLLFCLQRKDVFPQGDVAINKSVSELFGVKGDKIYERAAGWKPLRSLAAYFLWHHYLKRRNHQSV